MGSNPTQAKRTPPQVLIIDSGVVIALSRGDGLVRRLLDRAVKERFKTVVPPVVITETTRGGRGDARVNQVLKTFDEVSTIDEIVCRRAGRLLGRASSNAVIDALIVASAIELGARRIMTGDAEDFTALAADHPEITIAGF